MYEDLSAIGPTWERARDAAAAFAELARCLTLDPTYRMLTVSRWDPGSRTLLRVFSTDEGAYPVGGKKHKPPSAWSAIVLEDMRPHLSPDLETIRKHFDDHELIERSGITAILNIPVTGGVACLGTMNLMRASQSYGEPDIRRAQAAAGKLAAFLHLL
jgi:hypothetical protein